MEGRSADGQVVLVGVEVVQVGVGPNCLRHECEDIGGQQIVVADLASAYRLVGEIDEAAAILDRLLETRRDQYVPAICLARVYSRMGDTARAIEWLETAFAERNGEMVFLREEIAGAADGDPLGRLAEEPRVTALLARMNLP